MRRGKWYSILLLGILLLVSSLVACAKPATFEVVSLDVVPPQANAGESVTVTAQVKNVGGREGVYAAVLTVNGEQIETKNVMVAPGNTETVTFLLVMDKAGTYKVAIDAVSSGLIIKDKFAALEQLKISYPELYQELLRLPDLKEIDNKDEEALEDIALLALDPKNKPAFESMLAEGINDRRKYCTPLEALLWIAYDGEFSEYNPLSTYSLTNLLNTAWQNTTTSNNYTSERRSNFDEIVARLNSPTCIGFYMLDNFSYIRDSWIFQPAKRSISIKGGACSDQGMFAYELLSANGYAYDAFEEHADNAACILMAYSGESIKWGTDRDSGSGHITCLFIRNGLFYLVNMGKIEGPYRNVDDAATRTWNRWDYYEFRDIDAKVTKRVKR